MTNLDPQMLSEKTATKARRILVAEDDPVSQVIFEEVFKAIPGVDLTIVADGKEATALCVAETFDLFVLDLNLPGVMGNKIVSFIRTSSTANAGKPVILLSALPQDELRKIKGVSLATFIRSKPLDLDAFSAEVAGILA